MERFKVFDILHHEYLCQVNIITTENACIDELFKQIEERQIRLKFLAYHYENNNTPLLSFCVERSNLKAVKKILEEFEREGFLYSIIPEAGMVAIYGPHFGERPGIIDATYRALSSHGINILGISTTASTSFFVLHASEVCRALEVLKGTFEIPQGKA